MARDVLFNRLCYVFPACGITDLEAGVGRANSYSAASIFFMQPSSPHPHPRNGFFCMDKDVERYKANMEVYGRMMEFDSPFECGPVSVPTVEAFLSLANCNRAVLERRLTDVEPFEFDRVHRLYMNSMLLTQEESALQKLEVIEKHTKNIVFCSVDDNVTNAVPVALRMLMAEGFAGLSLVAYYRGGVRQVCGFKQSSFSLSLG